jgi:putative transposase
MCEVDTTDPTPRVEPKVGIDLGITNIIADSDRRLLKNPKFFEASMNKLARAQRTVSRRLKGSKNRSKAKSKVSRIERKIRRQRDHFLHVESTRYAKSHGIVILEDLKVTNMVKGNLGRQINDAGWGKFSQYLKYKLKWSGGVFVEVDPRYSSQTCAVCNHVDRASRSGEKFKCTNCGHEDHADLNASIVILNRQSLAIQPVEGSRDCTPRRSRKYRNLKEKML